MPLRQFEPWLRYRFERPEAWVRANWRGMPPELSDQIPPGQEIGSVTADAAFDTRKRHDAIAPPGAVARSCTLSNRLRSCPSPAPQERRALESCYPRRNRAQQDRAHIKARRPDHLTKRERCASLKPRRDEEALRQVAGPADCLPAPSAVIPYPCPSPLCARTNGATWLIPERLHGTRNASHRTCGRSLSGKGRRPVFRRFVQQSRIGAQSVSCCQLSLAITST